MGEGISYKASEVYNDIRMDAYDIVMYCDIYECEECPRYGYNCDGKGEDEDVDI